MPEEGTKSASEEEATSSASEEKAASASEGEARSASEQSGRSEESDSPDASESSRPRRMARRPAVAALAALAALGSIAGTLWMTGVFDSEPEAGSSTRPPAPATVRPSVTPSPANPSKDPLESVGFNVAPAVKDGDAHVGGDVAVRVLEFNPNAEEQVKTVETDVPSLVASHRGRYVGVKLQFSLRNKQYMTLDDPKVLLVGQRNRRIGLNIEKDSNKLAYYLHYKDERNPGLLFPGEELYAGQPMEGWIYFWVEEPFGKAKIYFSNMAYSGSRDGEPNYYRIDEPVG